MKTVKLLIILCVFLVGRIGLADDSGVFDSVSSDSALEAPKLTVKIDGNQVTLSWNEVAGASYYQVHYAQKPYDNPDTIKTLDVGDKTSAVYDLSPGSAYHVAVKACKDVSGFNCSYYSIVHDVLIPLVSTYKNSLGQEFKLIPAGTFIMGSPSGESGRQDDETQHQVTLTKPFYMQTTEVTQAQWEAVMGSNPSGLFSGCPSCPVNSVSWHDAQSYITEMNLRGEGTYSLPTEAQWEYAARAGSTTAFYNGNITEIYDGYDPNLYAIGWYIYDPNHRPQPVAQKTPNAWGLYDISGNVTEWCQDRYGDYSSSAVIDPVGQGPYFVYRGGEYASIASSCRSASRFKSGTGAWPYNGLRLTRAP
jgi:formylglycine-generating enzyme required for sulfatase activity